MKGQGIADFLAIASLRRDGLVPERDLVFVAEPGEETFTPEVGIGWVFEHRPDLLEGVTDVFNEGGVNEVSGDRIARFGIEVLQKAAVVATADAAREEDLKAFADFLDGEDERGALPRPRRGPGLPRLRRALALGPLGPPDERYAVGRPGAAASARRSRSPTGP